MSNLVGTDDPAVSQNVARLQSACSRPVAERQAGFRQLLVGLVVMNFTALGHF